MKSLFSILCWMLLILGLSVSSHAALIDMENSSGNVVYDDQSGQYWMWDLSAYTNMTYDEQVSAISDMNAGDPYFGLEGWHMPNYNEMLSVLDRYSAIDIVTKFHDSGFDQNNNIYWMGRIDTPAGPGMHSVDGIISWDKGGITIEDWMWPDSDELTWLGAWATTSSVPIPAAVWLLGSGLIGLVGIRRRLNK